MIRNVVTVGVVAVGFAFAVGFYVGWKTTLKITDSVLERRRQALLS